ncbi:hypothetical protein ACEPAG_2253 [Sanghuangporus baumii]
MTTDAMDSDLCYTVCFLSYLLGEPDAICFPISLTWNVKVQDLALKIRDEPDIRSELETKKLCLFKVRPLCGEVSMVPEDKVYNSVVEYFPDGSASREKCLIDVIAVSLPTLQALFPSSTLDNQTLPIIETTPRKSLEQTRDSVKDFLSGIDSKLRDFLSSPLWTDFWKSPSPVDRETAKFIKDLKIPKIDGDPMLLLHNLGDHIVDSTLVNGLFDKPSRLLVYTPGSGKTRLLFEDLTKRWGFYFTTIVDDASNRLGSVDMESTIKKFIPRSRCFTDNHAVLDAEHKDAAFSRNHYIAERRVYQVLRARILIFEHFLRLLPISLLGRDVFQILSENLKDASDEYLMTANYKIHHYLLRLQEKFDLGDDFYLILDEAQRALGSLDACFRSEQNREIRRPVLRPIIRAWKDATSFPVIVSGTGLSIDIINEARASTVMKLKAFRRATETGAFDTENRQREYILRYMPPHLAETESGSAFLKRAWNYARGRHRFTAILNAFINGSCGLIPSDCRRFVEEEQEIVDLEHSTGDIKLFDFSIITHDPHRLNVFNNILHTWLILQERTKLLEEYKDLVELGFARFVDSGGIDAYADEPIVLLAAARHFDTVGENKGFSYETSIAHYLACAFDDKSKLCDIFDFRKDVPKWAEQSAELVSVVLTDEKVEVNRFHLIDYLGSTSAIATLTSQNKIVARECAARLFNRLNKHNSIFDSEGWYQDGVPVLKVIVSTADATPPSFHAMLKRDRSDKMVKESLLQERMTLSLGTKRVLESDFGSTSCKKPRT